MKNMDKTKAPLNQRILAGLIDGLILILFINASYFLLKWSIGWWLIKIPALGPLIFGLIKLSVTFLIPLAYLGFTESSPAKATPGKLLCGLKVLDRNGERLNPVQAGIRTIVKLASALPLGIVFLMIPFTESRKALHDVFSDSQVVEEGPVHPFIDRILFYIPDLDELFRV